MTWRKSTDKVFYVYQYLNDDGLPYYIGKGCGKRITNKHRVQVPTDARKRQIIQSSLTEAEAFALEAELTRKYGLLVDGTGILENKIHGGGNVSPRGFKGKNHSDKTKRQISVKNKGRKLTEEQCKNRKGPQTEEHREKIRQSRLGTVNSEERNLNISKAKKGKPWSEARRAAQKKNKTGASQ